MKHQLRAVAFLAMVALATGCNSTADSGSSPASSSTPKAASSTAATTTSPAADAKFVAEVRGVKGYSLENSDASLIDLGRTAAQAFESTTEATWQGIYEQVRDVLVSSGFTKDLAKSFIVSSVKYYAPTAYSLTQRMSDKIVELRTKISSGIYIAGTDIEAGRYKTDGASSCYFETRHDPTSGSSSSIIENDNLQGPGYFSVQEGQGVKISGTCTFAKVA